MLTQSEQAIAILFPPPRRGDEPGGGPGGGGRRGPEGYRGGAFFLALLPDGSVLANPQQVNTGELAWPQSREPTFATIQLGDGDLARVVLRRTFDGGLLVVGQSLEPEQSAMRWLLLVLVGGGGIGFLLSLAAAWFLSGRALVPIQQAFQRQQEFVADASHELRTPLTVLRSATDLMNQHRDQPLERNGELFDDVRARDRAYGAAGAGPVDAGALRRGWPRADDRAVEMADVAAEVVRRTTPLAHSQGIQLRSMSPSRRWSTPIRIACSKCC